nr:YEATS-associated helix-containing protein [uncultured Allomuricauda sp.]
MLNKIGLPLLTVLILAFLIYASFHSISVNTMYKVDDIKAKQQYEKLIAGLEDKEKIKDLTSSFKEMLSRKLESEEMEKLFQNEHVTFKIYKETIESFPNIMSAELSQKIEAILSARTDSLYMAKKELLSIKTKDALKPNFWLIALIILSAGILGGYARTGYQYLMSIKDDLGDFKTDLLKMENNISTTLNSINSDDIKTKLSLDTKTLQSIKVKADDIEKKIGDAIQKEANRVQTVRASVLFGIIASSISLLALNLTESKILEFESGIDYFILWGWCVLGAVYAKNWIANIYDRISTT